MVPFGYYPEAIKTLQNWGLHKGIFRVGGVEELLQKRCNKRLKQKDNFVCLEILLQLRLEIQRKQKSNQLYMCMVLQ